MQTKNKKYHLVGIPKESYQLIQKQLSQDEKTIGVWVNNRINQMLKIKRKIVFDKFQEKLRG
jgi:predicted thioesterase